MYTYVDEARDPDETVTDQGSPYRYLYAKIVRLTFDPATGTLSDPVELIAGLPASNDHNSGRVKIGPDLKTLLYDRRRREQSIRKSVHPD